MSLDTIYLKAIKAFLRELNNTDVTTVNCHYQLRSTLFANDTNKTTMRCHPKYRGHPWFDWIQVNYEQTNGDIDATPSRLLLWLSHKHPGTVEKDIFALVHSMRAEQTPKYSDLNVWKMDCLYEEAKVVSLDNSVAGPCFVLPGVSRRASSNIEDGTFSSSHYLVLPDRTTWHTIGWGDVMVPARMVGDSDSDTNQFEGSSDEETDDDP